MGKTKEAWIYVKVFFFWLVYKKMPGQVYLCVRKVPVNIKDSSEQPTSADSLSLRDWTCD